MDSPPKGAVTGTSDVSVLSVWIIWWTGTRWTGNSGSHGGHLPFRNGMLSPWRETLSALWANCERNTSITGVFPSQRASNTESYSMVWRHHGLYELIRLVIFSDGPIYLNRSETTVLEQENTIPKLFPVKHGGAGSPANCTTRRRVAIIVPYRDREQQLGIFIRHMHPILIRQLVDYRIFLIQQVRNNVPLTPHVLYIFEETDKNIFAFPHIQNVEIWEWTSNFIPHFIVDIIIYPCWN